MAGKKKSKVVPIVPTDIEVQIESGQDPREHMTPEQIQEFIRKEEEMLARRIGKFVNETPQPDTKDLEEEDEGEVFTLDLEKKTVEQKVEAVIVGDEGLVDKVFAVQNPYTEFITSILVSKALAQLVKTLRAERDKIDEIIENAPTAEQAKALREVTRVVYDKQLMEIKSCWITGTNDVKFDKIPEWAQQHIKTYINDRLRTLIEFSED